jgi:hypothetical protein
MLPFWNGWEPPSTDENEERTDDLRRGSVQELFSKEVKNNGDQ